MTIDEFKMPAQLRKFVKKNDKKKPQSLRKKVLNPLLIAVLVISIVMALFFNIVFMLMLYSGVTSDLKGVSSVMEQVMINDTRDNIAPEEIIEIYKKEIDKYAVSYHANLVVLKDDGKIAATATDYQHDEHDTIEKGMLRDYKERESEGIFNYKIEEDSLVVMPVAVHDKSDSSVFIYASMRSLWSTLVWGNRALLVIIAIAVICFFVASNIIAHNISKPIKDLSDHMEVIGDGNFSPVADTDSSAEMQTLTMSINEMLARLQAYHDAHTRSIQNLSHDLKTPLMSIGGYAEGIKYGVFDNVDDAADVIIKESKRLTQVVEKMLILSDLDALHQPIDMVPLELTEFLDNEVERIIGYAMQENVKIEKSYDGKNETVLADNQLLSTIIQNILSNAIRYAKKKIDVKVYEDENNVKVSIADDGNGLSKEDLEYLFVRYYVGKTGHSGLGLSAAKSAAEYMGCSINGANRNSLDEDNPCYGENGAVFTLTLPKYN